MSPAPALATQDRQDTWGPTLLLDCSQASVPGHTADEWRFATRSLDQLSVPYHGRIGNSPRIQQAVSDVFFGTIQVTEVLVELANGDGALTPFYQADPRGAAATISRYDVATGTTIALAAGRITKVGLARGKLLLAVTCPDVSVFNTELPNVRVSTTTFGTRVVDLGAAVNVVFGNVQVVKLPYINDDIFAHQYDYLVGAGSVTAPTLYRDNRGSLEQITTPEFTVSTSLYSGYTVVRFFARQVTFEGGFHTIYADIGGLQTERNFARAIQTILTNTVWGLSQSVDTASFDTVAAALDAIGGLYCDGVIRPGSKAQDVLAQLCMVRGLRLGYTTTGLWTLAIDALPSATRMRLGTGPGDGERNIVDAGPRELKGPTEAVGRVGLQYRRDEIRGEFNFEQFRVITAAFGQNKVYQNDFVRDHTTADKITSYLGKRHQYGNETCPFVVSQEARRVVAGDLVEVYDPSLAYTGQTVEVTTAEHEKDAIRLVTTSWDSAIYTYSAGSLPIDLTAVVQLPRVPRPGGLELYPDGGNSAIFRGRDIKFVWHALSRLPLPGVDEDNFDGLTLGIRDYEIRILVSGVLIRSIIVNSPEFTYSWERNLEDNDGVPGRDITFQVRGRSIEGEISAPAELTAVANPIPTMVGFTPTVRAAGDGALLVDWSAWSTDAWDLDRFAVLVDTANPPVTVAAYRNASQRNATITGLDFTQRYRVRVIPYDSFGAGTESSIIGTPVAAIAALTIVRTPYSIGLDVAIQTSLTTIAGQLVIDSTDLELDIVSGVGANMNWGETDYSGLVLSAQSLKISNFTPAAAVRDATGDVHILGNSSAPALSYARLDKDGAIEQAVTNLLGGGASFSLLRGAHGYFFLNPTGYAPLIYWVWVIASGSNRIVAFGITDLTGATVLAATTLDSGSNPALYDWVSPRLYVDANGDAHVFYVHSLSGQVKYVKVDAAGTILSGPTGVTALGMPTGVVSRRLAALHVDVYGAVHIFDSRIVSGMALYYAWLNLATLEAIVSPLEAFAYPESTGFYGGAVDAVTGDIYLLWNRATTEFRLLKLLKNNG